MSCTYNVRRNLDIVCLVCSMCGSVLVKLASGFELVSGSLCINKVKSRLLTSRIGRIDIITVMDTGPGKELPKKEKEPWGNTLSLCVTTCTFLFFFSPHLLGLQVCKLPHLVLHWSCNVKHPRCVLMLLLLNQAWSCWMASSSEGAMQCFHP